jgi:hypothetical protein
MSEQPTNGEPKDVVPPVPPVEDTPPAPPAPPADEPGAGSAVEQKAGDACTCPDGRPGTLHDQDGTLVCLPNQG